MVPEERYFRVQLLLVSLGIEPTSFLEFLEWALSQQLVAQSSQLIEVEAFYEQKDALKQFRKLLKERTQRDWSVQDLNKLFDAVKATKQKHFRDDISYGEYLKLLWNSDHKCTKCKRHPPEVELHIDHIVPVSLGGKSQFGNIQFLCSQCNLQKSNKLEEGKPWLDLR